MILSLTRYTTRLALRVKNVIDYEQFMNWRELQLLIAPGEDNKKCCHVGGSPWVLTGCWPFHPTGVDVANPPQHDFPIIILDAFDCDDNGRIVFRLDQRVHALPNGRYTGMLRMHPHTPPINLVAQTKTYAESVGAMVHYNNTNNKVLCDAIPYPLPQKQPKDCILAKFDIDLGPECAQHIVDQCAVELTRSTCGEICGEEQ